MRRLSRPALSSGSRVALGFLGGVVLAWALFRYWDGTASDAIPSLRAGRLVEVSGDGWLLAALALSNTLLVCMTGLLWKKVGLIPAEIDLLARAVAKLTPSPCQYDKNKVAEQLNASSRLEEIQKGLTGLVRDVNALRSSHNQQRNSDDDPARPRVAAPSVTRQRTFEDVLQDFCAGGVSHVSLISAADRMGLRWGGASAHGDTVDRITPVPGSDDRRVLYFERAPNSAEYVLVLKDGAIWDMNLATWFSTTGVARQVLDHGPRVSTAQPAIGRLEGGLIRVVDLGSARVHDL